MSEEASGQPIVVGIDGSEPSLRALRWAVRQARATGGRLEVITAWTFPDTPAPLGIPINVADLDRLMVDAQAKLDEIVVSVVGDDASVDVETKVIRGNAAVILVAEAEDAGLLVVGRSGRGHFEHALLGSVSERCVRLAHCPVVVVG